MDAPATMFPERLARARALMAEQDLDVLLLSVGADLPYLIGYEAMPLERLTMLVLRRDGTPALVIPKLEAPRVVERPDVFEVVTWTETEDPVALVAKLMHGATRAAIGDTTWARFLVDLLARTPGTSYTRASSVIGPLRAVKDAVEIEALRRVGAAVDRIAAELQSGRIPLIGRTEADVSAELGARMLAEGHHRVNFAIVAAGENAASPHHEAGHRVIRPGEVVLCDFGGTMLGSDGVGYCSDITRCVHVGEPSNEFADLYAVLHEAQVASVRAATVGTPCEEVDAAGRRVIEAAGYGEYFIHRTGHGIGVEAHEDPYIVAGNATPLAPGHAFSIEPGIYIPGRFGARLEDIVVAGTDGPDALNRADHRLAVVDG
jgi:Xaa-Pro aminopeptidase